MTGKLRCFFRILVIAGWSCIVAVQALPGMFAGRRGIRRNADVARRWASGLAHIMNIKIRTRVLPGEHSEGGLVVSNHHGYLDILALGAKFPFRYMPKAEIRLWPVLGWIVALNRPIWIHRESRMASSRVADELDRTLQEGIPVLAFPEGTTSDGKTLLPFKSTPFEAAVRTGIPLQPVLLRYAPSEDGYPVGWFDDTPFVSHVLHSLGQPGFEVEMTLLPAVRPLPEENRKALATRVREIMLAQYQRTETQK